MSESKALTVGGAADFRTLAQLTGQDGAFNSTSSFPRVRINTDFIYEDEDGKEFPLPPGAFAVKDPEGREIFAKTVEFRPFVNRSQYRRYDPKAGPDGKGATVSRSILVSSLGFGGEEPIDDTGGVACGKVRGKDAKGATFGTAQTAIQEQTKAYRYVYGLIWIDGTYSDGTPGRLDAYPCHMRMRGTNYMPIGEVFDGLAARKRSMQSVKLKLSTKREKNGDTTYYIIRYEHDPREVLPITESDIETIQAALAEIADMNADVLTKHQNVKVKKKPTAGSDLGSDFFDDEAA